MTAWPSYIDRFHRDRPGITEALLGRCVDGDGANPYQWLIGPVPTEGKVLDVGCGSGPTGDVLPGWIGVDLSLSELRVARRRGRAAVAAGDSGALPVATASASVVLAAMSLMVVDDPAGSLVEVARVLQPAGRLVLLLPDDGPLSGRDRLSYGLRLLLLGRRSLPFPQPDLADDVAALLTSAGFTVDSDERARFACPMRSRGDRELLIESLYLPDVSSMRVRVARAAVQSWGRAPLGLPLRRVIATLDGG